MATLSDDAAVRRLTDRFGFGLGGDALARAQAAGFDATLTALLRTTGRDAGAAATPLPELPHLERPHSPKGEPRDQGAIKEWRRALKEQQGTVQQWWLDRMTAAEHQGVERMTWFWHGHFATSVQKVRQPGLMLGQNEAFRRLGLGSFTALAQALVVDPALLVWLDGDDNTAKAPNENLGREFMELFSLGPGSYTEDDVKAAAHALTGWTVQRATGQAEFRPRRHDPAPVTLLGVEDRYDARSFVDQVLAQPASARFVVGRVWARLVSSTPPAPAVTERLVAAYGRARDIRALLVAVAAEPAFHDSATSLVKQPVEWLIGLLRALDVRPGALEPKPARQLSAALRGMGQLPFRPPSVGGWPAAGGWLTTGGSLARLQAARLVAQGAPAEALGRVPQRSRVEHLRRTLGVDRFSTRTSAALTQLVDHPVEALAIAACSPEYAVSG